jgi:hypothetical protein
MLYHRWAALDDRPLISIAELTPPASTVFSACPLSNFVLYDSLVFGVDSHLLEEFAVDSITDGRKKCQKEKNKSNRGKLVTRRYRCLHDVGQHVQHGLGLRAADSSTQGVLPPHWPPATFSYFSTAIRNFHRL